MNAPVNIVYPIKGEHYPKSDPGCKIKSAYITASFSTTCQGGPRTVSWGFDGTTIGRARFYDQFTAQFVHKLPAGPHTFWVKSSCGEERVEFVVG
jgi:hypothetical protein